MHIEKRNKKESQRKTSESHYQ